MARDAPKEFKYLLEDLRLLKIVLWYIRDNVTRGGKTCSRSTQVTLHRCFHTLYDFEALVAKYDLLGEAKSLEL